MKKTPALFMRKNMGGIVIIGAGECGTRAAFALRETGYPGAVTLIGAEAHPPYERPPLSKPAGETVILKEITSAGALAAAAIDYQPGRSVSRLEPEGKKLLLSDGQYLDYDRLLLATGASPRPLTCPGANLALAFRTYDDAAAIFSRARDSRRIAIIGGGLIGMELAAVLRCQGRMVSVIEAAPKPLGRAVPPRFAEQLGARHQAEGVVFYLGQGVAAISGDGVTLADGTVVAADLVVSAIGVIPATALAAAAGIATGDGILTDRYLRTNLPDVFAAGDCAAVAQPDGGYRRQETWRNARAQAEIAARNLAGGAVIFEALPWFWSDQYDLNLQVVGQPRPGQPAIVRRSEAGEIEFYLDHGRLTAAAALGRGNSLAKEIKLAELLIAAAACPDPAQLADPKISLKTILKNMRAA